MAESFNLMQEGIANAAGALDGARAGCATHRSGSSIRSRSRRDPALGRRAL